MHYIKIKILKAVDIMMASQNIAGLPEYQNPPVIEVVCGLIFNTLHYFRANHIGLYGQKISGEFPTCEHAQRLEIDFKQIDLANYLPRIWFINTEQNRLIQLEDSRFYYNWRRIKEDEGYPHYSNIKEEFGRNLNIFQQFIEQEKLGNLNPQKCELTYINHIPRGEGWESLEDINKIFRDFGWDSNMRFLPAPINIGGRAIFLLPEGRGNLDVTLQHARRKIDEHPILIFQLTAKGLGVDKSLENVWEWFEIAHEWIVRGFTDLTCPEVQEKVWKRTV